MFNRSYRCIFPTGNFYIIGKDHTPASGTPVSHLIIPKDEKGRSINFINLCESIHSIVMLALT